MFRQQSIAITGTMSEVSAEIILEVIIKGAVVDRMLEDLFIVDKNYILVVSKYCLQGLNMPHGILHA